MKMLTNWQLKKYTGIQNFKPFLSDVSILLRKQEKIVPVHISVKACGMQPAYINLFHVILRIVNLSIFLSPLWGEKSSLRFEAFKGVLHALPTQNQHVLCSILK